MKYVFLWTVLGFQGLFPPGLMAQQEKSEFRILWYNVENLFHPEKDSLSVDLEFTPEGARHWTKTRYQDKLTKLSKVILAAGGWEPPEVVGLCEVEGVRVLEDLINHTLLKNYSYKFLHRNSPDHRGLDVACLYRPSMIGIWEWSTIRSRVKQPGTRDMMHICLTFGGNDTLELFLLHFISKYRGAGATAESRRIQAEQLVQKMDSVLAIRPGSALLLAGDFNDAPGSYSLEPLGSVIYGNDTLSHLSPKPSPVVEGTYKFRGRWDHFDQFYFCDPEGNYAASATIFTLWPLLVKDEEYGGIKPIRTYFGYQYTGGISDHLPLMGKLRRIRSFSPADR